MAIFGLCALQGGYMLFDGLHRLRTGSFFGNTLGPWARVVAAAGLPPGRFGPVFVVLGALWLLGGAALVAGLRGSQTILAVLCIVSLFYLPFGTLVSVVVLVLLWAKRPSV